MSNTNTYHARNKQFKSLPTIYELEPKTADLWLSQGTITITSIGSENTYYVNEFGMEFYCKNYPQ
jgi:hypothetical protein